ncbi:ABC-2 type transport system ATP-binding protein [Antricoccus suffuscus]|uniref:ABC-2 type transport system ATP-binding protein n=1 Tax=Antricoccus suffuscus TaxID=1629062 RepID=A0A2T1A2C2_9ACTN|nr:ABC transporter ATP-binding protein [Antricoccus suffuscus]PRZ42746.1 ABC-2 type transport system ATP-binding protein [Antricoccus suffuscus]
MTTTPSVEVNELRRSYGGDGGYEAVRGVSFEVRRGELFALLGTNGAGKTSTLEVVEGLSRPTGGTVRVLGKDPYADRSAVRPDIGIMLQSGGLPGDLTALETARMWADSLVRARPPQEALEMVGLAHRASVAVKALSGGERRRLDLALSLTGWPKVLFLDEPTTGLDPQSRHATWALIDNLVKEGCAIVLTTHYLEEAQSLADHLAIMHEGRIVAAGTPEQIAAAYPSTIAFELPQGLRSTDLPAVNGERTVDGSRLTLRTGTLQRDLTILMKWAEERSLTLTDLQARSASLEEAFLAIAGSTGPAASQTLPEGVAA